MRLGIGYDGRMPLSTDVELPIDAEARWPDRCVACGVSRPGETWSLSARATKWVGLFLWWLPGTKVTTQVPACRQCRTSMRTQRWARTLVVWLVIAAAVWGGMWYLETYEGPFKKWIVMALALVCVLPIVAWEVFFPPATNLTVDKDVVQYEFASAEYATEFAALNGVALPED